MSDYKEEILCSMQKMDENDFTKKIIKPLFERIGYYDVDFNGGVYEKGKDLICWKKDELDTVSLTVAQVKKFKTTKRFDTRIEFRELVLQLSDAASYKVQNKDGNKYFPDNVYFITPFVVDTRLLEEAFSKKVIEKKVKILDGNILYEQLDKKAQDILSKLLNPETVFFRNVNKTLGNSELMNALNHKEKKDAVFYYSDLNFSVGSVTSAMFFELSSEPVIKRFELEEEDWRGVRDIVEETENYFEISIISPPLIECERDFKNLVDRFESRENQSNLRLYEKNKSRLTDTKTDLEVNTRRLRQVVATYEGKNDGLIELMSTIIKEADDVAMVALGEIKDGIISKNTMESTKVLSDRLETISLNNDISESIKTILANIRECKKVIDVLLKVRRKVIHEPRYRFELNGTDIAKKIHNEREYLREVSSDVNSGKYSKGNLKIFLNRIYKTFKVIDRLVSNAKISSVVGFNVNQKCRNIIDDNRFTLSLHAMFDAGVDMAVFGDAGAGKTTTLQKYAYDFSNEPSDDEVAILLPLNRIGLEIAKHDVVGDSKKPPLHEMLLRGIVDYFRNDSPTFNIEEFIKVLSSKKRCVLLFDGVDEAIKTIPWIICGVSELSKKYKSIQVIISSRVSGDYVKQIDFLGVSLLPFTNVQRERFIKGWFSHKEDVSRKVINHISDCEIQDVIKNPLLATILCVLAENNVPLPHNEIDLYQRRMRLLAGYYDSQKGISRNKFESDILIEVAKKIAYMLHERERREARLGSMCEYVYEFMNSRYTKYDIEGAVKELVDPCNILTLSTHDGKYGFGHLRYQEYLVAEELSSNRSIDIVPLTTSTWWRGAMVMYSKMLDDLSFLIEEIYRKSSTLHRSLHTLEEMVNVQPLKVRGGLADLLAGLSKQDSFDQGLSEFHADVQYDEILRGEIPFLDNYRGSS